MGNYMKLITVRTEKYWGSEFLGKLNWEMRNELGWVKRITMTVSAKNIHNYWFNILRRGFFLQITCCIKYYQFVCMYMRIKFELEFNLVQTINGMREIIKHTLRVANNNNNKENNNSNRNNDNNKLLGHKKCLLLPAITLKSGTVTAATTKSV